MPHERFSYFRLVKSLIGFFVALLVLASCGQKEEKIDFDDLAPVSERYGKDDRKQDTAAVSTDERPDQSDYLRIADTLLPGNQWKSWDTTLFADRFGPQFTEKWIVTGQTDSMTLQHYVFRDSLRTKNAFFNYLDCFGPKCRSYMVGDNLRIPKRNGLVLIGEKNIYILEANRKIDEAAVRKTLVKDPKEEKWLYIVTVPKSGKTVWKRIDKGNEVPLIKTL